MLTPTRRSDRRRAFTVWRPLGGIWVLASLVALSSAGTIGPAHAHPSGPALTSTVPDVSNTTDLAEAEESIAINPTNPDDMLIGSNVFQPLAPTGGLPTDGPAGPDGVSDTGLWRTEDAGRSWTRVTGLRPSGLGAVANPLTVGPAGFIDAGNGGSADQDVVFDRSGRAIYETEQLGTSTRNLTIDLYTSADGGRTWAPPVAAVTVTDSRTLLDRPFLAVDNSGGPDDGTIYLTWETIFFQAADPQVFVTASTDHGRSFGPVARVDDDAHQTLTNPRQEVAVDGAGTLYDLYSSGLASPVVADPGAKNLSLTLAASRDGGRSFTHTTAAQHIVRATSNEEGDPALDGLYSALAADPHRSGHITIAWPDATSGAARILLRSTTDGGISWSPATDITGIPADQAVECSDVRLAYLPDGRVAAIWRDRRFTGGTLADPFDVWLRILPPAGTSTIAGAPIRLTAVSQPSTTGHHGFEAGYLGVAAGPGFVAATWDQLVGALSDNVMTTIAVPAVQ